ncbi:hypothetical protein LCGC14_2664710 [marine sediment metagenome]|uniref:Uncharacterized protein n=1 Tax=marine sediment metagenome TaxID=412755 RepID=A0A0F9CHS7_9ZZZZ
MKITVKDKIISYILDRIDKNDKEVYLPITKLQKQEWSNRKFNLPYSLDYQTNNIFLFFNQ